MTPNDETPRSQGVQMLLRESEGQLPVSPERMKWLSQIGNNTQLWMCLMVKLKFDAVKNNTA